VHPPRPPAGGSPTPEVLLVDPIRVTCIPPHGTHVTTEVAARVDFHVARVGRIIRRERSVAQKVERI